MNHLKDIGQHHWIGRTIGRAGWKRTALHQIERNTAGGSTSWPVAEIDIVEHPSADGVNPHHEVKISLRNEVRKVGLKIIPDGNKTVLRHPADIIDPGIFDKTVEALIELGSTLR